MKSRCSAISLLLLALIVRGAEGQSWVRTVTMSQVGATWYQAVRFGVRSRATDGIDESLGEILQPPWPPASIPCVLFVGPDLGNGLNLDLRAPSPTVEHVLSLRIQAPEGPPVILRWNPAALAEVTTSARLHDPFGGSLVDVDMRTAGEAVIEKRGLDRLEIAFVSNDRVENPAAVRLAFVNPPAIAAPWVILPPIAVHALTASGVVDTDFGGWIDLWARGVILRGVTRARAVGGVARFDSVAVDDPHDAGSFTLEAEGSGLRHQIAVRLVSPPARHLALTSTPERVDIGLPASLEAVAVGDSGRVDRAFAGRLGLRLVHGAGRLVDTVDSRAKAGRAWLTLTYLTDAEEDSITLAVVDADSVGAQLPPASVSLPLRRLELAFAQLPDTVVSGQALTVDIQVRDAAGDRAVDFGGSLELAVLGPGQQTIDIPDRPLQGLVTFPRVIYRAAEDGETFRLQARLAPGGYVTSLSAPLVADVVATHLRVVVPSQPMRGGRFSGLLEVAAVDANGRRDHDFGGVVTLAALAPSGALTGNAATAVEGLARLPDVAFAAADPTLPTNLILEARIEAGLLGPARAEIRAVSSRTVIPRRSLPVAWNCISDTSLEPATGARLVVDGDGRVWAGWQLTHDGDVVGVRLRAWQRGRWGDEELILPDAQPIAPDGDAPPPPGAVQAYDELRMHLGVSPVGEAWYSVVAAARHWDPFRDRGDAELYVVACLDQTGYIRSLPSRGAYGFRVEALAFDNVGRPLLVGSHQEDETSVVPAFLLISSYHPDEPGTIHSLADNGLRLPPGEADGLANAVAIPGMHVAGPPASPVMTWCCGYHDPATGYGETLCYLLYPQRDEAWGAIPLPGSVRREHADGSGLLDYSAIEALVTDDVGRAYVVYSVDHEPENIEAGDGDDAGPSHLLGAHLRTRAFSLATGDSLDDWEFPYPVAGSRDTDGTSVAALAEGGRLFFAVARNGLLDLWVHDDAGLRGPFALTDAVAPSAVDPALATDGSRLWVARDDGRGVYVGTLDLSEVADMTATGTATAVAGVAGVPAGDDGFQARVWPNPSNAAMVVAVDVPLAVEVQIEVFDTTGQRVRRSTVRRLPAGPGQRLQVPVAGLASGVYLVRLSARADGWRWGVTLKAALLR